MKNIINILAVLSLLFTANACEEGDAFEYYDFVSDEYYSCYIDNSLNSNNIDVSYKRSIVPFRIYSTNAAVTSSALPSWASFVDTTYSYSSVYYNYNHALNINENLSRESRSGILTLKYREYPFDYFITQAGADPYLTLSESTLEFPAVSVSPVVVTVSSNEEWTASCPKSWVTLAEYVAGGSLTILLSNNTGGSSRSATVYVTSASGISKTITIEQQQADVNLSYENVTVPRAGKTGTVTVNTLATYSVECNYAWIDFEKDASNPSLLRYTVQPNTTTSVRTGYLYVKVGTKKVALCIKQHALQLSLSESTLSLPATGGSKQFSITTNDAWEINKDDLPSWLTIDEQVVLKDSVAQITVTAAENVSAVNSRSYKLYVYSKSNSLCYKYITIQQDYQKINLNVNTLSFSSGNDGVNVLINSTGKWTASSNDEWITVKAEYPFLYVSVTENTSTESRDGTVTVSLNDKDLTIKVHQACKYFNVKPSTDVFTSKGGKHTLEITSDDTWSASLPNNVTWLTLSATSGSGNGTLTLTAADNPYTTSREAQLTLTTGNGKVYTITFNQPGRTLAASVNNLIFPKRGGETSFSVVTDGKFQVTKEGDWFSFNVIGNNIVVTTDVNSTGVVRSGKLIIRLTDLLSGACVVEVPVTQYLNLVQILLSGYGNDVNLDDNTTTKTNITIGGYGNDVNLD